MPELNDENKAQVRLIVSEMLGVDLPQVDELKEDENLLVKFDCDSLDQVELIMELEDTFGLNFDHAPDSAYHDARSLADLYALIAKYPRKAS